MADISVSTRAYCKLILHAAKYPHRAVNGVLLAEKNKGKEPKSVKFVDAIPLFHLTLGLAPMLEVALTQVSWVVGRAGKSIPGRQACHRPRKHLRGTMTLPCIYLSVSFNYLYLRRTHTIHEVWNTYLTSKYII